MDYQGLAFQEWRQQWIRERRKMPDFGELMRKWQTGYNAPGQTIQDFTNAYGIPARTVHNWLSGVRRPPAYVLWLLAYAMETDNFEAF